MICCLIELPESQIGFRRFAHSTDHANWFFTARLISSILEITGSWSLHELQTYSTIKQEWLSEPLLFSSIVNTSLEAKDNGRQLKLEVLYTFQLSLFSHKVYISSIFRPVSFPSSSTKAIITTIPSFHPPLSLLVRFHSTHLITIIKPSLSSVSHPSIFEARC